MSTLEHVILHDKDQDVEKRLDWSCIEWAENEVVDGGLVDAQTQTVSGSVQHKESQTSSPVIMHIDLSRSHSKLRHLSLVDADGLFAPLSHFDRQAPGRISTSPTLRRMRSTRRPLMDTWNPENGPSPLSPLFPVHRVKSPLAASTVSDGESCHHHQTISSWVPQRPRSHRSKTLDNIVSSKGPECHSTPKNFIFPEFESQVSFFFLFLKKKNSNYFPTIATTFVCVCVCVMRIFIHNRGGLHIPSLWKPALPRWALPPAAAAHNTSF